jgi:hypothetical protein
MTFGADAAPLAAGAGAVGSVGASLALTGLSMASADVLVRLALGEHLDAAELAMAAIPLGPRAKRLVNQEGGMIGEAGTQLYSKELDRGKGWRLDVENPHPGQRPGQIHLQDYRKGKWQYDLETGRFVGMPRKLEQELLRDPRMRRALEKALRDLGEEAS